MVQKSVKINAILSTLKTFVSLIVPLITFPYISRVLQVEAVGKYNFAASIVSYFALLAGLGIATYALREGAHLREDRQSISRFASEMVTINALSALVSMALLVIIVMAVPKLRDYWVLIAILGVQIPLTVFGRSWIYNIYEDFSFLTLVQITCQLVSVVALFLFVHTPQDVEKYAITMLLSSAGAELISGIHSKKYIDVGRVAIGAVKRHIKPILIIFSTAVTAAIYVNSDTTILGFLIDDEAVGIYGTAVKVYNIVKNVITAIVYVLIPRLTLYTGSKRFEPFFKKSFEALVTVILPAMVGLFILSDNVIEIIAGVEFMPAQTPLRLLSIALGMSLFSVLFAYGVLIPTCQEKPFLVATIISAAVNIVLNFTLIPMYSHDAAAFTTVIAEAIVVGICCFYSGKYVKLKGVGKTMFAVVIGCIAIVGVCMAVRACEMNIYIETTLCVVLSVIAYGIVQLLLKNEMSSYGVQSLKKIVKKFK